MKARNLLLLLVFLIKISIAQNFTTSDILNDTIWASDTVKVYNDFNVAQGTTLTIDPGVYVEFQGNYSLTVYGRIKAIGTQLDSITFTIHDTTSFGDTSTLTGGWGSIKLLDNSADTSIFCYCKFSYGKSVDPGHCVDGGGSNNVNFRGGAIYAFQYSNLKCVNSTFTNNIAIMYGGGIWMKYFTKLEFSNNLFKKNMSFFEGGAVKIESGTLAIISENRFIGNITFHDGYNAWGHWVAGAGGGIYVGVNSNAIVMNNWFCNNTAANGSLYETDYNCVVYNNIIANNMGVGLFNGDEIGTPKYINNTVVNNLAWSFESGIFTFSKYTLMINNIVYGNKTTDSLLLNPIQVYTLPPNKADFSYGCNPDEPIYYEGVGNIHDDPMFVNPTAGAGPDYDGMAADWSLQDGSPCVNAGTPDTTGLNLPEVDIAGNPRLYGIRVDMGAYENQVVVGLPKNPLVNAKIEIVPNPFKDSFTIHLWGENKVKRIALINQSGITVKALEHFPDEGLMLIDLNGFSSGLYLVVVAYEDGTRRIEKVLKE